MACAYRHDVLDKSMAILGDAIDEVMRDEGWEIGDLVNKLDGARQSTVLKMNSLMARSGPLLRLAATDGAMSLASRVLDIKAVRRAAVALMHRALVKALGKPESEPIDSPECRAAAEGVRA